MATTLATRSSEPIEVRVLAREADVHPDLVRHFVALGLLEPHPRDAAARIARAARLRRDLGLNYAGAVLACELLARIDELQRRLSRYEEPR
jgi:DNA-binding transcriptional MerR regulator